MLVHIYREGRHLTKVFLSLFVIVTYMNRGTYTVEQSLKGIFGDVFATEFFLDVMFAQVIPAGLADHGPVFPAMVQMSFFCSISKGKRFGKHRHGLPCLGNQHDRGIDIKVIAILDCIGNTHVDAVKRF